jgi:DTW domain-containing protein YfiP
MAAPPQHAPEQPAPRRRTCDGCGRPPAVCLCSSLPVPRLQPATRVIILQHPKEARRKVVKTADLIASCLASGRCELLTGKDFGSELKSWADSRRPDDRWLLLWPGADARPIDTLAPSELEPGPGPGPGLEPEPEPEPGPRPLTTLLVLDGTWQQAKQLHALNKVALDALCSQVSFPAAPAPATEHDGGTSSDLAGDGMRAANAGWIRLQPRDHFLSTLESVGLALRILEGERGPGIYAALLRVFDRMNERQRVFYTAERAHAPARKQAKAQISALEATLVEPAVPPTEGKPKQFILCREERTAEDRRVMREVGDAVVCTFDGAHSAEHQSSYCDCAVPCCSLPS